MIDLYYWPTPNGLKIVMMLEECGLPYRVIPVDIGAGEQFTPAFLKISPNNKIPAIVDPMTDQPFSLFESGAILMYLAKKSRSLLPREADQEYKVLQWLFWQVGGLGPMAGQFGHFKQLAAEPSPYATSRYRGEYRRLLAVMDRQLETGGFLVGDYSIADIACWPWVHAAERLGENITEFAYLNRWYQTIFSRPATQRSLAGMQ
ncbi:glutathione S-transferase N-terminal domain-containing protein [Govanella unica]|uniref:Glutathione S-transferase N-terminal domain-containing protein n=1 Tax=Govanella unica TaxID=2975056 RepID=A0A9X3Z8L9_9PROT|nr:glutathione S-transferase N-terminal domain-containing protein [Govania unica]MDA5195034.1 glutathione S-transferase N-terminal domain-containing protein [Govania unica]